VWQARKLGVVSVLLLLMCIVLTVTCHSHGATHSQNPSQTSRGHSSHASDLLHGDGRRPKPKGVRAAHTHPHLLLVAETLNLEAFALSDQRFLGYFLGVGSMVAISVISFCLLVMLPFGKKTSEQAQKAQDYWLSLLVSFAVGALLGDAFLHLIPSALGVHSHEGHPHSEGHKQDAHSTFIVPALSIVGGMLLFFSIAKIMRSYTGGHDHSHGNSAAPKGLQPAAYLNTFADMVHNFTDGLALGTSWGRSTGLGLSTTLAVFFHEIPHELGDMGILIKSGASKWQALAINSVSAMFATLGAAVGVYLGQSPDFAEYVLPVTAGGFIYVAMTEMMPQLQESPSMFHSVGIALGIFLMLCVSLLE